MSPTAASKRAAFRSLHAHGCFVVPNPWDAGSARLLQGMGFKALATTSAGHAWAQGRADGTASLDETLDHLRLMVAATDLPVNADFGNGFGACPDEVCANVRRAVATGIAGLSIEDATGDPACALFATTDAVARIRAARAAISAEGGDTLLVGRADGFFVGRPDLGDTVERLQAYAAAGADCLYAPGLRSADEIRAVVAAVRPKPVNLLIARPGRWSVAEAHALGVRRISVGGALAHTAWNGFMRAARDIALNGSFGGLAPGGDIDLNAEFGAIEFLGPG